MISETLVVGSLGTNCYVLGCERTRQAIVIDPGDDDAAIMRALKRHDLALALLVVTHAHFDHILAARPLQEATGAPFRLHAADQPLLQAMRQTTMAWIGVDPGKPPTVDGHLVAGETIRVGDVELVVRVTPGHSPGGITLVESASHRAFTGDSIFAGSIGRADLPGGNQDVLLDAIHREILTLPDDYLLLPGHGPSSTVLEERTTNPFLMAPPHRVRFNS
jgi:hydroxyacylglutathione hydrolase